MDKLRNGGLGTEFLTQYLSQLTKPLIIEVERSNTIIAKRRIEFYKRLGFVANSYDYIQPSYHSDKKGVPMYIVSYKNMMLLKDYKTYVSLVRKHVYNIK